MSVDHNRHKTKKMHKIVIKNTLFYFIYHWKNVSAHRVLSQPLEREKKKKKKRLNKQISVQR